MNARATSLVDAAALVAETAHAERLERAKNELLTFPAEHLPALPLHVRISVQAAGFAHPISLITFSAPDAAPAGSIVFAGDELRAVALAAQAERMWPADFKGFCLHKLHDPSFRLGPQLALAGAQPNGGRAWPLGRVLRWLDLALVDFAFIGETGVRPDAAAA